YSDRSRNYQNGFDAQGYVNAVRAMRVPRNGLLVMLNALTVDVEDYFQVEAFSSQVSYDDWDSYTPRVEKNTARVLDMFSLRGVKATFFVLGWVAKKFPHVVRHIAEAGHEIGCHGFAHRRIDRQTPEQFRADIQSARNRLTDLVQQPIRCYR